MNGTAEIAPKNSENRLCKRVITNANGEKRPTADELCPPQLFRLWQKKIPKIAIPKISRLMNARAIGNQAYVPTPVEHIANVITHGIWVLPSFWGFILLLNQSSSTYQYISALVYGLAMVALYTVSTSFHSVFYLGRFRNLKEILHRCDRAIIYIFIAASYTPWLMLKEMVPNSWGQHVRWFVWLLAFLGITYQQIFHEKYKTLETIFYLIMGLSPATAILYMHDCSGLTEVMFGGCAYMVGVVFFKCDGIIPCAHAIWHICVNIGVGWHYYAISTYLMGEVDAIKEPEIS